jgi:hypothetical protein
MPNVSGGGNFKLRGIGGAKLLMVQLLSIIKAVITIPMGSILALPILDFTFYARQ